MKWRLYREYWISDSDEAAKIGGNGIEPERNYARFFSSDCRLNQWYFQTEWDKLVEWISRISLIHGFILFRERFSKSSNFRYSKFYANIFGIINIMSVKRQSNNYRSKQFSDKNFESVIARSNEQVRLHAASTVLEKRINTISNVMCYMPNSAPPQRPLERA